MGPSLLTLTRSSAAQIPPRPTTSEELPLDPTVSGNTSRYEHSNKTISSTNRAFSIDQTITGRSTLTPTLPRTFLIQHQSQADRPTTMPKQRTSGISLKVGALNPRRSKRERKATTRFVEGWFGVRLPSLRWALQRVGRNGGTTALVTRGLSSL